MSPVWGHRLEGEPKELSVLYCAGRDVKVIPMADEMLISFDIWNTEAHNIRLTGGYFVRTYVRSSHIPVDLVAELW